MFFSKSSTNTTQKTCVSTSMLDDQNLSFKARGFICYCMSKPENLNFNLSEIRKSLKVGETTLYSMIKECIEKGYAIRYQPVDENGKFLPSETIVSDSKEEIKEMKKNIPYLGRI